MNRNEPENHEELCVEAKASASPPSPPGIIFRSDGVLERGCWRDTFVGPAPHIRALHQRSGNSKAPQRLMWDFLARASQITPSPRPAGHQIVEPSEQKPICSPDNGTAEGRAGTARLRRAAVRTF